MDTENNKKPEQAEATQPAKPAAPVAAKKPDQESPEILKSLRDVSFLIGIYLLFSGWVYIYYFLDFFGISIRDADVDYSQFVIYSYQAMAFYTNTVSFWLALTAISAFLIWLTFTNRKFGKRSKLVLVIFVLGVSFPIIFTMSKYAGMKTADKQLRGHKFKTVKFIFKEDFVKPDSNMIKTGGHSYIRNNAEKNGIININEKKEFTMIMSNKEKYFVIYTKDTLLPDDIPLVYSIKKDDIYSVKVYMDDSTKRSKF